MKQKTRLRRFIIQVATLALVITAIGITQHNYAYNVTQRNIGMGFGFLNNTAGFSISQTLIPYDETSTFASTYVVGVLNTLLASAIGIVLATVLGFVFGIMRLSNNWLVNRTALAYVELLRNLPPLLHVLFWYQVFFLRILPPFQNPIQIGESIFISIRGITVPEYLPTATTAWYSLLFWLCIVLIIGLSIYRRRMVTHGKHLRLWPFQLALLAAIPLLAAVMQPYEVVLPQLGTFRFDRGSTLRPELFSLVVAMATYTSTYIAEIVRSSILAVPKGQLEAARSLGLTKPLELRLVVLPQAMRTMIPPLTNQFLNLIKNTSLGVAIAYPDLTAVFAGTALNQSGRALEIMLMVMFTYLSISLVTSALMNWYNRSILNKKGAVVEVPA